MGTGTQAARRRAATRSSAANNSTTRRKPPAAPPAAPKRLLSVPEAALELGVCERKAWMLVAWGRAGRADGLESITVGGSRKVPRVCLDRYIERRLGDGGLSALAIA